jgi:hypothetical protein
MKVGDSVIHELQLRHVRGGQCPVTPFAMDHHCGLDPRHQK